MGIRGDDEEEGCVTGDIGDDSESRRNVEKNTTDKATTFNFMIDSMT